MNVFVLEHTIPYVGRTLVGVYASREDAQDAVAGTVEEDWYWCDRDGSGVTTVCTDPEWSNYDYVVTRVAVQGELQ